MSALLGAAFTAYRQAERRLARRAGALEAEIASYTEELREANRQLEILAKLDSLTGLANRCALEDTMEKELRRAASSGTELSLVLIDVDYFKLYNDSLGHVSGDDCLRRVAAAERPADLVARYGGEEFAVLVSETAAPEAAVRAENLRHLVQNLALPHPASPVASCVTISAGVAGFVPASGFAPAELVAAADEALYRAKQHGRNRVATSDFSGLEAPNRASPAT